MEPLNLFSFAAFTASSSRSTAASYFRSLSVLWLSANASEADEATLRLEPQQYKLIKNLKLCLEKSAKDGCELLEKCSKIQFKVEWDRTAHGERESESTTGRDSMKLQLL